MPYDAYRRLRVSVNGAVATVVIDNPPINLLDFALIGELDAVGRELEADETVKVVVLESADAEFFIAHADVELILTLPEQTPEKADELNFFHAMVERFRTMPKATIAKIAGIARGGGSELALSCDMRFAALGKAVLAQPEVALGILPGGSGTQRLSHLVGRARALEIVLGCGDISAELAERWGYVNRALPAEQLDAFVDKLARRIASFPAQAIKLAKQSVNNADELGTVDGLLEEAWLFSQLLGDPEARAKMKDFLKRGGQTREVERRLGTIIGD